MALIGNDGEMSDDTVNTPAPEEDEQSSPPLSAPAVDPEVMDPADIEEGEGIEEPGKVIRIAAMIRRLLEEVREAPLDEASRTRMREVYETSIKELASGLSAELREELDRLSLPFANEDAPPSEGELRIAQAQLVGWLEGLFHGIQATLVAQQVAAHNQLQQMARGLPRADRGENPTTGYL